MKSTVDKRETAIEVINVKKKFKSYMDKAGSFKEMFVNPSRSKHKDIQVLKGISFEVYKGEAVGIIGKNGCGKSTTLKLLTRILYPSEGKISIKGRVSSLIELGAGFHPDMTGRENIYTNASIFGLTRKEVDKRLSAIIRFSELEEFIDNPIRTYSSGMYMRLAFAVAINVDADVLLIDEILAVGDSSFQKKCFEKLKEIKASGTTIVIVSHSMDQMYKICDRLIWLEDGQICKEGVPRLIGEEYLAAMEGRRLTRMEIEEQQKKEELERLRKQQEELQKKEAEKRKHLEELAELERKRIELERNETAKALTKFCYPGARRQGSWVVKFDKIRFLNEAGEETVKFKVGEMMTVEMEYSGKENVDVNFIIGITRNDGVFCYGSTCRLDCKKMVKSKQKGIVVFKAKNTLAKGTYVLDVRIRDEEDEFIDNIYSLIEFKVYNPNVTETGIVIMDHSWTVDGRQIPIVEKRGADL